MSGGCKTRTTELAATRRVLLGVLAINLAMFAVEGLSGFWSGSLALQADALDFLGDSSATCRCVVRSSSGPSMSSARQAAMNAAS